MNKALGVLFAALILLTGCQADKLKLSIYTADIAQARQGEVIEIPMQVSFELFGDDREGTLDQVVAVVKKYLPEKTKFSLSKSMMGRLLVIDSTIPIGEAGQVANYLRSHPNLLFLAIDGQQLMLNPSPNLAALDAELSRINLMLSIDPSAKSTVFDVMNDERTPVEVSATAVFISKSPKLEFRQTLERRDSVEIEFSGEEGSVYKELHPRIQIGQ